ncbi:hypothetical protein PHYBOEH_000871 [Phytophthora boehmeriae]|uniref:Uncharacterized protein n=1 Tax=Phytophthora boehmeriae TaxID=109152 RepID=A0A8T1X074_9STRA|nr:hypothetical protein PHYBOEH_000871 [Phytophthora boehmeriae]
MSKPRRTVAYSAEYEFGDDNILTAAFREEKRLRNEQRIKQAHSVLDRDGDDHTVNNAKRIQLEQDRELEISQQNLLLLERLERIHKKLPKQYDVSRRSDEYSRIQGPTNYHQMLREQERIAEENKRMKRRLNQAKSLFDNKQLAVEAEKQRYFSGQLSKADRRLQMKQKCKLLESQSSAQRMAAKHSPSKQRRSKRHQVVQDKQQFVLDGIHECQLDQRNDHRQTTELPRVHRSSYKVEVKYAPQESCPTITNTSKLVRASDLLPRLGHYYEWH